MNFPWYYAPVRREGSEEHLTGTLHIEKQSKEELKAMNGTQKTLACVAAAAAFVGFVDWMNYRTLNGAKNAGAAKLMDISVFQQRRGELFAMNAPIVSATFKQEHKIFVDGIAKARVEMSKVQINAGSSVEDMKKFVDATNAFNTGLAGLRSIIVENYPQLGSTDAAKTLMIQGEGSQNRISVAQVDFNDIQRRYNDCFTGYFCGFSARLHGFTAMPSLVIPAESTKLPDTTKIN